MKKLTLIIIGLCLLVVSLFIIQCKQQNEQQQIGSTANSYVGSDKCQSCHQQATTDWTTSHHFRAMQHAADSTVLGDFNQAVYIADGVKNTFFKKGGKFYINTEGPDGKYHHYLIKYTFGFTPLQQYLIEFPGGKLQATRASWDTEKKKWFHQYAGEKLAANDWLHWTGNGQNWNTMCASCHSTNLQKGYNPDTDTYTTTYNEINVSCESCHGPGNQHIQYITGNDYKSGEKIKGSLIALYVNSDQHTELSICGNCHARRTDLTGNPLPGKEFMNDYIAELPTSNFFHADGQMNEEDYNYTSFLQSKMYQRGVKCSNCHQPHSGELRLTQSNVCSQCHDSKKYEAPAHRMHDTQLTNVNCITCHMPSKLYMGNDERHDHSFRIPRPDLSVQYNTPNTCNSCHKNKSASWAAAAIQQHYGPNRNYHFAEDLLPGSLLNNKSAGHLVKLIKDTSVPSIVRAAAMNYLGKLGEGAHASLLLSEQKNAAAHIRFESIRALENQSPIVWANATSSLTADPVKAVRIAAAGALIKISSNEIPADQYNSFVKAKEEYQQFIIYQTDFAQGCLQAGDYFMKVNDAQNAERFYKRAIAKDSQLVNARVNYAAFLNANNRNQEALYQLTTANKIQPGNDHILYSLGLLYGEMNEAKKAIQYLQDAVVRNSQNQRLYYNLAILYQQNNQLKKVIPTINKGLAIQGNNPDLLYLKSYFSLQQKDWNTAYDAAKQLYRLQPNEPEYQSIYKQLQIIR